MKTGPTLLDASAIGQLCRLDQRVLFFPVRHHSPTAARLIRQFIETTRPTIVLVEGPSDFNERLHELRLPHRLPIAIYSYVRLTDGRRRSAYYPFCVYSPEWQAIQAAGDLGIPARFIDRPWADLANHGAEPTNRYADADLQRGRYVSALCKRMCVENFDSLWDALIEIDANLSLEAYLERCHGLCSHIRLLEGVSRSSDLYREEFMAEQVKNALAEQDGQVVVVTGGYHSLGLYERVCLAPSPLVREGGGGGLAGNSKAPCGGEGLTPHPHPPPQGGRGPEGEAVTPPTERGIALTPYTYERLDSLVGYEAGLPNPGFYHQVWHDRLAGQRDTHRTFLSQVTQSLRERGQVVSSADLIAVETVAGGLANLRGHPCVSRADLLDGLTGALIKDDLAIGGRHPLLDAVHEVFRGGERGRLAPGTVLPPLVDDIHEQLANHQLRADDKPRDVELDLDEQEGRARSRVLHRVRLLAIPGYERTGGTDLAMRDDLATIWERWRISWGPEFDAACIEAARYGPTLADAAAACVTERSAAIERDATRAALLLLDAALAGLADLTDSLFHRVVELVRGDGDFFTVTAALGHLLYLFRYDEVLETAGRADVGNLVSEAFQRGLALLESLGRSAGRDREVLNGIRGLVEALERAGGGLQLDRAELLRVLSTVASDRGQSAVVRGAGIGARWSLGDVDLEQVRVVVRQFGDPARLGDFLTGLFALAREAAQRQPSLVRGIDELVSGFSDDDFLAALPALRLAFTAFTPREKNQLALTLRETLGLAPTVELAALEVSPEVAMQMTAFEARLFAELKRFGLRGA